VGKPEANRLLGRRRRRWDGNIKMDLVETGGGGIVVWINLGQLSSPEGLFLAFSWLVVNINPLKTKRVCFI
jgi:hypothetical protein